MKKKLFNYSYALCLLTGTIWSGHPFLGNNQELRQLRALHKEIRCEKLLHKKAEKQAREEYQLAMIEKYGCTKQKRLVADRLAAHRKECAKNEYASKFLLAQENMDTTKKNRYQDFLKKSVDGKKEQLLKVRLYKAEQKQLKLTRKENARQAFYCAKMEKKLPKAPVKMRKGVKSYGMHIAI